MMQVFDDATNNIAETIAIREQHEQSTNMSEQYSSESSSAPSSASSDCAENLDDSRSSNGTPCCSCCCHSHTTQQYSPAPVPYLPTPEGVVPLGAPPEFRGVIIPRQFRTKICKFFEQGLPCPYGNGCAFDHGDYELRSPQQNEEEGVAVVNTVPVRAMVRYYSPLAAAPKQFAPAAPEPRLKEIQINRAPSQQESELSSLAVPMPSYKLKKLQREQQRAAEAVEASSQQVQQPIVVALPAPTSVYTHNPYAYNVC